MKYAKLSASLLMLLAELVGCENNSTLHERVAENAKTQPDQPMSKQEKIATSYDNVDNEDLPAVIPFNDEQRKYMIALLSAVLRVINGTSDLHSEEIKILGEGKYFWPKDPKKPVRALRYYTDENFLVHGITLSFERQDERASWQAAGLALQPRNFPHGVYDIGLPQSFFDEFQLIKTAQETREGESIPRPIVFYFSHKTIRGLTLKVQARPDLTSVNARFPSSFYVIEIARSAMP
jgi:hypothetical protein